MGFANYTGGRFVLVKDANATIKMGPFVDEDDGKTLLTGLTISAAQTLLSKNDGAFGAKSLANVADADVNADGWYDVYLSSGDVNTQGNLLVAIHATGALPVWRMFEVDNSGPA